MTEPERARMRLEALTTGCEEHQLRRKEKEEKRRERAAADQEAWGVER